MIVPTLEHRIVEDFKGTKVVQQKIFIEGKATWCDMKDILYIKETAAGDGFMITEEVVDISEII